MASDEKGRTVLTAAEVHGLAKIAAVVHENGLLDPDLTSPEIIDLCRRCSEALARREILAIAHSGRAMLTAFAEAE